MEPEFIYCRAMLAQQQVLGHVAEFVNVTSQSFVRLLLCYETRTSLRVNWPSITHLISNNCTGQ